MGFLTSPAPNAGVIRSRTPELAHRIPAALASRAERVLEVAAVRGYRRLVLGAWECGVFMNDPVQVAGAFRALLDDGGRFSGHFERVVFGILDRGGPDKAPGPPPGRHLPGRSGTGGTVPLPLPLRTSRNVPPAASRPG